MLRFSIIIGIILSTFTFYPLKAFDESDDTRTPFMTLTTLFKPSETVSLDSLRDKLTATGKMGPNGVGFLININGILVEVARLHPNELELNKDWHKQWRRQRKQSTCKRAFQRALTKIDQLMGIKL